MKTESNGSENVQRLLKPYAYYESNQQNASEMMIEEMYALNEHHLQILDRSVHIAKNHMRYEEDEKNVR